MDDLTRRGRGSEGKLDAKPPQQDKNLETDPLFGGEDGFLVYRRQ
jgi:hypothetical protein